MYYIEIRDLTQGKLENMLKYFLKINKPEGDTESFPSFFLLVANKSNQQKKTKKHAGRTSSLHQKRRLKLENTQMNME